MLEILGVSRLFTGIQEVIDANRPKSGSATPEYTNGAKQQVVISDGNGAAKKVNSLSNGANGTNGAAQQRPWYQSLPALLLQVSIFQTTAGPIGFLALRHISYPMMVLGKVGSRTFCLANT